MSSPLVQPPIAKTKALYCPNCGGPIELRGFGHALTAVCPQCLSVLDASSPELTILQKLQEKMRVTPIIPLGTRGTMAGAKWEVIGFQTRSADDDSWDEFLLFNPYKGFRYLTHYLGHWNYVTPMEALPTRRTSGGRPAVSIEGRTFKHFSGAEAETTFVLGEFPWRVSVGEQVIADDFVDPPTVLSCEHSNSGGTSEITWSRGEYTPGAEIWKVFALPGSAPSPQGVYLNQPAPVGKHKGAWRHFLLLLGALIVLAIVVSAMSSNSTVFQHAYRFSTADNGEPSFVTPVFELKGHPAGLELDISTDLSDNWAYFNLALINEDNGQAFDFGREVSYYSGSDSDGAWSEGGRSSDVYIPSVPPGHYYLRVEPEMDAPPQPKPPVTPRSSYMTPKPLPKRANVVNYTITLRAGVPNYSWFWIAALLLLIPPIFYSMRSRVFETKRWMQSDYPPVTTSGGSDD